MNRAFVSLLALSLASCAATSPTPTPRAAREPVALAAPAHPPPRPLYAQNGRPSLTRRFLDWTGIGEHLPHGPDGSISLFSIMGVHLELTPSLHDPLTAVGACADLVTSCYGPALTLDQCIAGVRPCSTAQPWQEAACCPVACRTAYETSRRAGTSPNDAFQNVFFRHPDCFPGVNAMVTATP